MRHLFDPARQREVQRAIEAGFRESQIDATVQTGSDVVSDQSSPVSVLVTLLLVMALLTALVGGLGLLR